jgi:sugar transferase (PEP-CTERM system associated)
MKVLGHYLQLPIIMLIACEFVLAVVAFSGSGYLLASPAAVEFWPHIYIWAPAFSLSVVVGITSMGLYQVKQRLRIEGILARLAISICVAAVCMALVNFFLPIEMDGPIWSLSLAASLILIGFGRTLFWWWIERGTFQHPVLVIGAGERAANLLKLRRRSDRRGFHIVGFVPTAGDAPIVTDERVIQVNDSFREFATRHGIEEIVVAMDDRRKEFPMADLLECRFSGIDVIELVDFLERETGKLQVELASPSWLIFSDGFDSPVWLQLITRALDFATALALLVLAMPLMLAVALATLLDDGWPLLYKQRRVGRHGKHFTLYKFRSMVKNAEADGAPRWASKTDRRVTRVGAFLRKMRLDELPQLFNVLRGDMSLVGPRPERPEFVAELNARIPYYHERHCVKPGMTGWAQVSYPYGAGDRDAQAKLEYDLFYIKHKSLIFDLMILLQTAEVVLWGKGAR